MFTVTASDEAVAEPEVLLAFKNWRVRITAAEGRSEIDGVIQDLNFVNDTVVICPWNTETDDADWSSEQRWVIDISAITNLHIF